MTPYKVTKEIVETAKGYLRDMPKLTNNEIGKLSGVSGATVSRIRNGEYDYLLGFGEYEGGQKVKTSIPYEELKKLWTYEIVIKELLANCKICDNDENVLFLPFKAFDRVLKQYIPDEVEERLTELQEENTEYSEREF